MIIPYEVDAITRDLRLATAVCVPLTSNVWWADAPGNVLLPARISRSPKDSVANVLQILTIDRAFLNTRVGKLAPKRIARALSRLEGRSTLTLKASRKKLVPRSRHHNFTSAAMTNEQFRRLALSLTDAAESAHMGHPDFRVGGRIFATLGYPGPGWAMVKLAPAEQEFFLDAYPDVFVPIKGAWGRAGCTNVELRRAKVGQVREALAAAWRAQASKARKPKAR